MSDYEREQERVLRELEDGKAGGLDEATETWTPLTEGEQVARHNTATALLDDAGALTGFAREILEVEGSWWKSSGLKESAIREKWHAIDLSPTRYYQLLNMLIDTPAAYAYDVMTVKRLSRIRDARRDARAARTDPDEGSELW